MANSKNIDVLAATTPFDSKDIMKRVSKISIKNEDGEIVTRQEDRVISKWKPSDIYEIVDFKDSVKMLLNVVENVMDPKFYQLTIKQGYQELKIKGNSHIINGDTFHEMLWLTNSSNGTRSLSVRYGLMRQICSNGAVSTKNGASFKVTHLTSNNVNEEMKKFMTELPKLDVAPQIKILKKLGKKEITIGNLSDALINKLGTKGNDTAWKLLVQKLTSSKTDRLGDKFDAAIKGINVPFKEMSKETLDMPIPAWSVFNCYTELFRSLDSGNIELETNKILDILV
jgi:hypothetical protein